MTSTLYVLTNPSGPNAVQALHRDPQTGLLEIAGRYASGGLGNPSVGGSSSHGLASSGDMLYAVNPGSASIAVFQVRAGGNLRLVGTTPSGRPRPVSLALHGSLLYVANQGSPGSQGSYAGFRVQPDGSLAAIDGSEVPLRAGSGPSEILFSPDGEHLVACRLGSGVIDSFRVGQDGLLQDRGSLSMQPGPFGACFSPQRHDQFFVALAKPELGAPAPGVASYAVVPGGPQRISGAADASLKDPCWLAMSPRGDRLWASSFLPRALTLYEASAQGELSQLSSLTDKEGPGSTDILLDASGRFLYQLRAFSVGDMRGGSPVPRVAVYEVGHSGLDGGLHLLQSLELPDDLDRAGVMGLALTEN